MKYLLIISIAISLVVLFGASTADGLWIARSGQDLLENSQTIFVGNITGVKAITLEKSLTYGTEENGVPKTIIENYTLNVDQYSVDVEEFLKNPQTFDNVTVRQPLIPAGPGYLGTIGGFKIGDRVLFYLDKIDGENTYSPESFLIPKPCIGKNVLEQKRLQFGGDFTMTQNGAKVNYDNMTANKSIHFLYEKDMGTLSGKSFDVSVEISKNEKNHAKAVFSKEIHSESKPCEWIAIAEWEFTPQLGDYNIDINTKRDDGNIEHSGTVFSIKPDILSSNYISPLQQFKSGIPIEQIQCKQGLMLVKKYNSSPACIKASSLSELNFRKVVDCIWNCTIPIPTNRVDKDKTTDTTMAIDGKSFYYYTVNETLNSTHGEGKKINFHNVTFTLFPRSSLMSLGGFCHGGMFGTSAKFSDGTHELLRIAMPEKECVDKFIMDDLTKLTNHTDPQAGLTVHDGKVRLLVSLNSEKVSKSSMQIINQREITILPISPQN